MTQDTELGDAIEQAFQEGRRVEQKAMADARREGARALLDAAFKRLYGESEAYRLTPHIPGTSEERRLSTGSFLVHLMWALDWSVDGLSYDIEQAERDAYLGYQAPAPAPRMSPLLSGLTVAQAEEILRAEYGVPR